MGAIGREVEMLPAVVRLGQDAVRDDYCGGGIAAADLLGDLTAIMRLGLTGVHRAINQMRGALDIARKLDIIM